MIIGSYQAFIEFVKNDNIQSFDSLKNCLMQVSKICNCQKQRKSAKNEECTKLYESIVHTTLPSMIDYLKSKTQDKEIVFTQNGGHEIRKFTLH